jgi:predicted metalloendopeptidase
MADKTLPLDAALMDPTVEPTADFYRYANGGWLDANPIPPEYGAWGAFHEVLTRNEELLHELLKQAAAGDAAADSPQSMVGAYFAAGMDTTSIEAVGLEPVEDVLRVVDSTEGVDDIRRLLSTLHPIGVAAFFGAHVAPDFEESSVNLLYIGQGGLGLPERDYYMRDDEQSAELRTQYEEHIAAQLLNLGLSAEQAAADAAVILGFETSMAAPSMTATQLRDVELTTNRHTMEELAELTPTLRLDRYLSDLAVAPETVNIDNPRFFAALDALLTAATPETVRAYLRWHVVRAASSALPAAFEDEGFRFYGNILGGQQEQRPRWKRVLGAAGSDIGEQVAQLYVAAAFSSQAKARCEELVDRLLVAMGESIRSLSWMGDETKEQALEKLAGFSYKIGYPDEWRDYSGLEIDSGPYIGNRMRSAQFEFNRNLKKLSQPVDETEWSMAPHVVNAYYHPLRNEIVFPAGILQPPFFYPAADDAINFGSIGTVIGHEITHGFDDQGSRFDSHGQLRNWWTDADRAEFDARAQVVVDQFAAYPVESDLNVNGQLTLGENIADLGGVTISFAALNAALDGSDASEIDGMTPHQRYFLAYATVWRVNYTGERLRLLVNSDPHSPAHFRCNGPLSNFLPFRETFPPTDGDTMLRSEDEIVTIW